MSFLNQKIRCIPGSIQCLMWCKLVISSISGSCTRERFCLSWMQASMLKPTNMRPQTAMVIPITLKGLTNQYSGSEREQKNNSTLVKTGLTIQSRHWSSTCLKTKFSLLNKNVDFGIEQNIFVIYNLF